MVVNRFVALLAVVASLPAAPLAAQEARTDGAGRTLIAAPASAPLGVAAYGPFRVLDEGRAALVDATDEGSLAAFEAMLREHPGIATLEMVECPGTDDDIANLRLGRLIRARGIATHVPADGSVRSGAVELFIAGRERRIDDGAEFAVHAWRDTEGREPDDFSADSPYNRAYVEYYRDMGLAQPQAFYDMTNAVPNDQARWLTAQDMRVWVGEIREGDVTVPATAEEPAIAYEGSPQSIAVRGRPYLDLGPSFP